MKYCFHPDCTVANDHPVDHPVYVIYGKGTNHEKRSLQ
jgi:hypothetical protein